MLFLAGLLITFISPISATVHIFGDSHAVSSFCNQGYIEHTWIMEYQNKLILVPYSIHWMGAITMYRIGRDGLSFLNIQKYNVQENDSAIFVFGEIDARCHIGKQRDNNDKSLEQVIDPLITNYLNSIQQNVQQYKRLNCIIFNILPPTDNDWNSEYPYYGTLEDRVYITRACNKKLKDLCPQYGFKFLDIFELYTDGDGSLNYLISDSDVHLNVSYNYPIKVAAGRLIDLEKYKIEFLNKLKALNK